MVANNELLYFNSSANKFYDTPLTSSKTSSSYYSKATTASSGAMATRSVAFDPLGSGQDEYVAMVSATVSSKNVTTITLTIIPPSGNSVSKKIVDLPFYVFPENAGAYLSVVAGNFDGDSYGKDEIAIYAPFSGSTSSGSVEIYSVKKSGSNLSINSVKSLNLRDQSSWYFYDNTSLASNIKDGKKGYSASSWKYMYRVPTVSLEAVTQPESDADDICITFTSTMGGQKTKDTGIGTADEKKINSKMPYDSATGVFFWIDAATSSAKKTSTSYLRFNWKDDYNISTSLDKNAANKWEVMAFGGAGAGDITNDGYNEVVVAGYVYANRGELKDGSDSSDWKLSTNEFGATYFIYDADSNTYSRADQCFNWITLKQSSYKGASNLGGGIYSNYDTGNNIKDMVHEPLDVTCFAERGEGYAESVCIGGIVCRLDTEDGVSDYKPYTNLGAYAFEAGAFNPVYAIPLEAIHNAYYDFTVVNRQITETVAGNFDGNLLGQEQLAFAYLIKRSGQNNYYTAYGIISQKEVGEQNGVENLPTYDINTRTFAPYYLGDGIQYMQWQGLTKNSKTAPGTIAAVDPDNDSYIMRKSTKANTYFFSNPEIIAVLQAAPFFEDVDYGDDNGETTFGKTSGSSYELEQGVATSLTVTAGHEFEVGIGNAKISSKLTAGVTGDFGKTWGSGSTTTFGLSFTAATDDMVALVMTPCVRYYYQIYDPTTKKWSDIEVDVTKTPRPSIITVDKYDEVAEQQGWELIRESVLTSEAGNPSSYGSSTATRNSFVGASTLGYGADNFVKLGVGDSSDVSQSIEVEKSTSTNWTWGVTGTVSTENSAGGVIIATEASIGYTGSKSKISFSSMSFGGKVLSVPTGYDAYSFAWKFGYWTDTLTVEDGEEQSFPVVGYLVKDVEQPIPPIDDPLLHVVQTGTNGMTLSWQANEGAVSQNVKNTGYILCRESQGVYYPLASFNLTDADDGWFSYTDRFGETYTEYNYVLLPFADTGDGTIYGDYISMVTGYTASDLQNIPKVTVTNKGVSNNLRTLQAVITPATGDDVGNVLCQWQQYIPEEGGWIDLEGGYGLIDTSSGTGTTTLTCDSSAESSSFRCRVTQRVNTEIYTVYSNALLSDYVFVAYKSSAYTQDNAKVVDYLIVHENGEAETFTSTNRNYNVNYIYKLGYDTSDNIVLSLDDNLKQRRTVTYAGSSTVAVNGGNAYSYDNGHEFSVDNSSNVWDVTKTIAVKSWSPTNSFRSSLLKTSTLKPKAGSLKENDMIAYAYDSNGVLRTAFVYGTSTWSAPSSSDDDTSDSQAVSIPVTIKAYATSSLSTLLATTSGSSVSVGSSSVTLTASNYSKQIEIDGMKFDFYGFMAPDSQTPVSKITIPAMYKGTSLTSSYDTWSDGLTLVYVKSN
ncbi:MAG: hypothetical protein LIO57_09520 [Oscillospiraceae bacterium]|nr:hypothetical protein [Oscillospiraceae bacterium]